LIPAKGQIIMAAETITADAPAIVSEGAEAPAGQAVPVDVEELLVEEVSIDGMCGVY
jgi:mycofactocin precursor